MHEIRGFLRWLTMSRTKTRFNFWVAITHSCFAGRIHKFFWAFQEFANALGKPSEWSAIGQTAVGCNGQAHGLAGADGIAHHPRPPLDGSKRKSQRPGPGRKYLIAASVFARRSHRKGAPTIACPEFSRQRRYAKEAACQPRQPTRHPDHPAKLDIFGNLGNGSHGEMLQLHRQVL